MTRKPDRPRGAPAPRRARDHAAADASSVLRRDAILVAPSPVGYLCIGLGDAARTLRFALDASGDGAGDDPFADPFSLAATMVLRDVAATPVLSSSTAFAKHADPTLDRLAAIAEIAKFGGYNPDEPRDEDGEWTSDGGDEGGEADDEPLGSDPVSQVSAFLHAARKPLAAAVAQVKANAAENLPKLIAGIQDTAAAAQGVIESAAQSTASFVARNRSKLLTAAGYGVMATGGVIDVAGVAAAPETLGVSLAAEVEGTAIIAEGRALVAEAEILEAEEGSFSIIDWRGYPANLPKPKGPFRLLEGKEYTTARGSANNANRAYRNASPESVAGKEVHETQPVKFGGSPTDPANKWPLTAAEHGSVSGWWRKLQWAFWRSERQTVGKLIGEACRRVWLIEELLARSADIFRKVNGAVD